MPTISSNPSATEPWNAARGSGSGRGVHAWYGANCGNAIRSADDGTNGPPRKLDIPLLRLALTVLRVVSFLSR